MNASTQPIRVLFLETSSSLSTALGDIFHTKLTRHFFNVVSITSIAEAARHLEDNPPDVLMIEIDPDHDDEMVWLARLHKQAPKLPIVGLMADQHQSATLTVLQRGAQATMLESQLSAESLPPFLFRVIERHKLQKTMQESVDRYRLMIENASDVILIMDDAGVIDYASPSAERLFNHRHAYFTGKNVLDLLHRDDRKVFFSHLEKAFQTEHSMPFIQFRVRGLRDEWIHMEGKGRIGLDFEGRRACVMNCRDVSHRVKLEEELRSLSLRDQLTGLPNRRSFVTFLEQSLKLAQRENRKGMYLLFIDLDGFKLINDTLGHKEGDRALIEAAKVLKVTFRDADLVARLGGDEFVVFLTEELKGAQVEILKQRLSDSVEEWNQVKKRAYRLAMSVGVVQYDSKKHKTVELMLRDADERMYKQKREKKERQRAADLQTASR